MSNTRDNRQAAFAGESQANRHYLFLLIRQKRKASLG
jgi:rubrerythrin